MSKLLAAAALLGSMLVTIEPVAAQKTQFEPTEAQKAECLNKAKAFEAATGHHGVTVRSDCLKAAVARNKAAGLERAGINRAGTTLPGDGKRVYGCTRPGDKRVLPCSAAEYKAQTDAAARAARMKSEMDAEARAYKKIQDERQRSKSTTEICYMKNGKLECKPQ